MAYGCVHLASICIEALSQSTMLLDCNYHYSTVPSLTLTCHVSLFLIVGSISIHHHCYTRVGKGGDSEHAQYQDKITVRMMQLECSPAELVHVHLFRFSSFDFMLTSYQATFYLVECFADHGTNWSIADCRKWHCHVCRCRCCWVWSIGTTARGVGDPDTYTDIG